jgi:uracil-DNA glycosylase
MRKLLKQIRECEHCKAFLPMGPRPVVTAGTRARIAIIGQAPGTKVHKTGIPWDDASGKQLRSWLGVGGEMFYESGLIALVPMGFCYPGKGKTGDLPPRSECAPLWHQSLLDKMPGLKLLVIIGTYSQAYYLRNRKKRNLTETVRAYKEYLPAYFPLPHPSPRNRFWLSKNPWFEEEVIPELQKRVNKMLKN